MAPFLAIAQTPDYGTYFGGRSSDTIVRIAHDAAGSVYLAGITESTDLPVSANALQKAIAGGSDAYVAKLTPHGALVYCTYLGGTSRDEITDFAVAPDGSVYVTGFTNSSDFPTTRGVYRPSSARGAFAARINADGSGLVYSTYLDSVGAQANALAVDRAGNLLITGTTFSPDFPTTPGALKRTPDANDVFLVKLSPAGTDLLYSTLLGGRDNDTGSRVAVDLEGSVYVAGVTRSSDFPTTAGVVQPRKGAGNSEDGFVLKLTGETPALAFSTFLGGSGPEGIYDMRLDQQSGILLTGVTYSADMAVSANAYQPSNAGNSDAFVARLSTDGTTLSYSSYLGGPGSDTGTSIAPVAGNEVYLTGRAAAGFPLTPDAFDRSIAGSSDAFVARLDLRGGGLRFGSVLGGSDNESGTAIAALNDGTIYVAGATLSADFPVTSNALQKANAGGIDGDGFVVRLASGNRVEVVSAASYSKSALAPESISSAFGTGLSTETHAAGGLPLPLSLGNLQMHVSDASGKEYLAPLLLTSPSQVNFLIPAGMAMGSASIRLMNGESIVARCSIEIAPVAPGLFTQNASGSGVAAGSAVIVSAGGSQTVVPLANCGTEAGSCAPVPVDISQPGSRVILLLYGTGIRGMSGGVTARIGGVNADVLYAGAQSEYPGLDQVNVLIPAALSGRGVVNLELAVDGLPANPVTIAVR